MIVDFKSGYISDGGLFKTCYSNLNIKIIDDNNNSIFFIEEGYEMHRSSIALVKKFVEETINEDITITTGYTYLEIVASFWLTTVPITIIIKKQRSKR